MFSSQEGTNLNFDEHIGNWNVSNVKSMSHMFFNATNLTNLLITGMFQAL